MITDLLSCDPELYASGGFPGHPAELPRLEAAGPAGQTIAELFPSFRYRRGADARTIVSRAPEAGRHPVEVAADVQGPPSRLYRVTDVILRDNVLYCARDGRPHILYETFRTQDRPTLTLGEAGPLLAAPPEPHGPSVFFSSSGSFNYGHWLVDDLPRLKALREIRRLHPHETITIVVTTFHDALMDEVRRQSIEVVLQTERNIRISFVPRFEIRRYPVLYFPTPVTRHPDAKSPEALAWLRERLRAPLAGRGRHMTWRRAAAALGHGRWPRLRRRLFVDRSAVRSRPLTNSAAIFARLEPLGFERLDLEWVSFVTQTACFAQAEIVVGSMGAAMTNTLFCRPGTPVIHLAPQGWSEPFFFDLAAVAGQRYRAVHGETEGDPFTAPFTIDPDLVSATVREECGWRAQLATLPARWGLSRAPAAG